MSENPEVDRPSAELAVSAESTIFEIDATLADLLAVRQDMLDADPPEDVSAIDVEIIKYFQAGLVKADAVRGFLLHGRQAVEIRRAESTRLAASARHWQARIDHLELRLIEYMVQVDKKRLEGNKGAILRKTNGGKATLIISNEALLPDEVCDMVGFLSAAQWARVPPAVREWLGINLRRSPNNALIREALAKPCPACRDHPGRANEHETVEVHPCPECEGAKTARVPGARLDRGQHIEIR